jgi:hypothetical protein
LQIVDAVNLAVESGIKKTVIVGGFEAYKVVDMLYNVGVLLQRVQ